MSTEAGWQEEGVRRGEWGVGEFGGGGQNVGRDWRRQQLRKSVWAEDEHERFIGALKRYGRDWKAIELSVGTRTAVQIRSHAQKYFIKLKRHNSSEFAALPPPRKKRSRDKEQTQMVPSVSIGHSPASSPRFGAASPQERGAEDAAGSPHGAPAHSVFTPQDYACVDALSLLVCAADHVQPSNLKCS